MAIVWPHARLETHPRAVVLFITCLNMLPDEFSGVRRGLGGGALSMTYMEGVGLYHYSCSGTGKISFRFLTYCGKGLTVLDVILSQPYRSHCIWLVVR